MGRYVHDWPLGFTARTTHGREPVGHAVTRHHRGLTKRSRYAALCGAPLVRFPRGELFSPLHPRACRKCAKAATP